MRRLVNRRQRLMATIINQTVITNKNLYVIIPEKEISIQFLLGILNSRLISRLYLSQISQATKDDFPQITIRDVLSLPMPDTDFSKQQDAERHDCMVSLVDQMLELHKRLGEARTPDAKQRIERQITATDRQIDNLVYELYGLTEEEIAIVEEGAK